jgi:hypothetical protein
MQTSVKDVLNRRGRSRFYSGHCCIVSEKRTKVFVLMLMTGILAFFAYDFFDSRTSSVWRAITSFGSELNHEILPCFPFCKLQLPASQCHGSFPSVTRVSVSYLLISSLCIPRAVLRTFASPISVCFSFPRVLFVYTCSLAQIRAYAKPSRQVQLAPLASLKIPGLLLCMVRLNRAQHKFALNPCARFLCACVFLGALIPYSRHCFHVLAAIYQPER